jgi:superfamily II DNA or RNA helicase
MVELIWGSGDLVIRNPKPAILQALHYNHKSLVMNESTFKRDIVTEKVAVYRELEGGSVTTFQGLLDYVMRICEENNIPFQMADMRMKMPVPKIDQAGDFMFGQRKLFFEFLAKNRSGAIKAPTRYGKTVLIANTCRVYNGVRTVVTAPGVSLLSQLQNDLKRWLPHRDIRGIYTGSKTKKPSEDITVVSMDSIEKCEPENVRLLLIDEPHAAVSPTRVGAMMKFRNARILGFGATLEGRFDGADDLIAGLLGPVLAEKTFKEAVAEGAICPIVVYMLRMKYSPFACFRRETAYKKLIYRNENFNDLVRTIMRTVAPVDWQSLIFVDEIKQADLMQMMMEEGVVAVASRMDKEERQQRFDEMVHNIIKRCICTDIYATGITFPDLRIIVNAAGGGGSITATQKPGRLAQVRPGKKAGYLVDFLWVPDRDANFPRENEWRSVSNDSYNRMANYKKIGFEVRIVSKPEDIKFE